MMLPLVLVLFFLISLFASALSCYHERTLSLSRKVDREVLFVSLLPNLPPFFEPAPRPLERVAFVMCLMPTDWWPVVLSAFYRKEPTALERPLDAK